jgi:hypothetical protein
MTARHTLTQRSCTVAAFLVALALAGCGEPGQPAGAPSPTSPADRATTSTATPSTSAPASSGELEGIPVYWIGETASSFRLYREFRTVPAADGAVASAVAAMTRLRPLDPDYMTPWRPASRVEVTQSGTALTVDLSADAISGSNVGSEVAARAVQQLVYTATAAAAKAGTPASTVTITIDGKPADAWGAVRLGEPTPRAPMVEVQSHAWVTSPQEGDELTAGPVTFKGFGTSFEANFHWKVTNSAGAVIASGHAMGGTGDGGFGAFTFTAKLAAGSYTVEVSTEDASGGNEGRGPMVDTKRFTVA